MYHAYVTVRSLSPNDGIVTGAALRAASAPLLSWRMLHDVNGDAPHIRTLSRRSPVAAGPRSVPADAPPDDERAAQLERRRRDPWLLWPAKLSGGFRTFAAPLQTLVKPSPAPSSGPHQLWRSTWVGRARTPSEVSDGESRAGRRDPLTPEPAQLGLYASSGTAHEQFVPIRASDKCERAR